MATVISIHEAKQAIEEADSIVICVSQSERWKATEKRIHSSVDDILEDSVIHRGHPLFEARAKAFMAQLQQGANEAVRTRFNKVRLWPFEIRFPAD
jgi:hypothetical protein